MMRKNSANTKSKKTGPDKKETTEAPPDQKKLQGDEDEVLTKQDNHKAVDKKAKKPNEDTLSRSQSQKAVKTVQKRKSSTKVITSEKSDTDTLFNEPPLIAKPVRQIVYGNKVIHANDVPPKPEPKSVPILFHAEHNLDNFNPTTVSSSEDTKQGIGGGPFIYALSDRKFIDNGWTVLPTEKVLRKVNVYRMRPAHPEFDWFNHNKKKGIMQYSSGERLAEIDESGRGRWYYKNGQLALNYYDCEETNAQQRYVVYSSGEPDERGRSTPITVLAMFDINGNGVVFDHGGKARLKYNQNEGIVLDRSVGPVAKWKWHSLNDPPRLQQNTIEKHLEVKDPTILSYDADHQPRPPDATLLAIENENYIQSQEIKKEFKPNQINMKTIKMNSQFTLKVLDQNRIYLLFRDGATAMKCNVGLEIDNTEIVDTIYCDYEEVCLTVEKLPAATESLADLQNCLKKAERWNQMRVARELNKRPLPVTLSADRMTPAASKPLRRPLLAEDSVKRKTAPSNMYHNTRLI